MPNKMLIDATHPEETRVVVLRGNRVEEFDFESANRKQLRGNIYLAKVTRVEPSLQAAFVDYGGNRHGFLAFSEIHPDYYQIPVADRQALIDEEERAARAADAEADHRAGRRSQRERPQRRDRDVIRSESLEQPDDGAMAALSEEMAPHAGDAENRSAEAPADESAPQSPAQDEASAQQHAPEEPIAETVHSEHQIDLPQLESSAAAETVPTSETESHAPSTESGEALAADDHGSPATSEEGQSAGNITEVNGNGAHGEEENVESVGGADAMEEVPERAYRSRRQYKIQEVIKRRQVMLVQVVKEERGTKGAALTTYLSLAGRYSVLMPNTARGGGISRKITSAEDRRRLKEIAQDLEVPEGMGVILRTAGAARTKTEVKRDFEYLLRMWETVRDLTLKSTAPTLVYEEGSLVKRSIRDLYNKDIDEVLVAGDVAYNEAKDFMRMLMPSHGKNVKPFRDSLPVFTRFGIESQLDAMFQPVVQLRSGGYIVLNQTEALVAIDVNSGRATREHHIEDTALKTNMEASEEIARQLRLRDLAGLIVIDFIDMDEKRNHRTVERRLKESLKHDRARIQVGHISHFGLLEMSRQRIRSSVLESSTEKCVLCGGTGHVRSVSSVALQLLRSLEEMLLKGATHNIIVRTRTEIALYLLNHKRAHLRTLEERFQVAITVNADQTVTGQVSYLIEKGELVHSLEQAKAIAAQQPTTLTPAVEEEEDEFVEENEEAEAEEEAETAEAEVQSAPEQDEPPPEAPRRQGEGGRGRRRRRGRGGEPRRDGPEGRNGHDAREGLAPEQHAAPSAPVAEHEEPPADEAAPGTAAENGDAGGDAQSEGERRRRRRGRRGGRRNRRDREGGDLQKSPSDASASPASESWGQDAEAGVPDTTPAAERHDEPAQPHLDKHEPERHEPRRQAVEHSEPPAPQPQPPQPSHPEAAEHDLPRRRSTIREPAPVNFGGEAFGSATPRPDPGPPAAPPAAQAEVAESAEAGRPRRSGWWSRRVLGKD